MVKFFRIITELYNNNQIIKTHIHSNIDTSNTNERKTYYENISTDGLNYTFTIFLWIYYILMFWYIIKWSSSQSFNSSSFIKLIFISGIIAIFPWCISIILYIIGWIITRISIIIPKNISWNIVS